MNTSEIDADVKNKARYGEITGRMLCCCRHFAIPEILIQIPCVYCAPPPPLLRGKEDLRSGIVQIRARWGLRPLTKAFPYHHVYSRRHSRDRYALPISAKGIWSVIIYICKWKELIGKIIGTHLKSYVSVGGRSVQLPCPVCKSASQRSRRMKNVAFPQATDEENPGKVRLSGGFASDLVFLLFNRKYCIVLRG